MPSTTKTLLSSLAVLAAASAPAGGAEIQAGHVLRTATRAAAPLSPCQASADDLVGEVALRLWARHRDVVLGGGFQSYVETSVRNAMGG